MIGRMIGGTSPMCHGVEMSIVAVTRPLPAPGIAPLESAGVEVRTTSIDRPIARDELLELVGGADALLCLLTDRIDAEVFDRAPGLRVVANYAVGYDNIDVAEATRRGIVVTNTPGALTDASADLAFALLLAAARNLGEGERLVRADAWTGWAPSQLLGQAVAGRTLGIVGMGAIGTAVARRARGFDMSIVYHNRRRVDPATEAALGARYVELDELLKESDFVSLHAPLNDESRHLIDARAIALMKSTSVIVNTGRGPLIDEDALVVALRERRIFAAGLDVYEREPVLADGLRELDNVILAPHLGSATTTARGDMVDLCCENILAVLDGREALTPVVG